MLPNYFLKDIEGKYCEIIYIDMEIEANLLYNYLIGTWQMGEILKREKISPVHLEDTKSSSNKYVR